MNTSRKASQGQKGQALFVAIIFLLVLTFLGFGLISVSTIDIHSSRNLRLAEEALSAAEEGVMVGMAWAASDSGLVGIGQTNIGAALMDGNTSSVLVTLDSTNNTARTAQDHLQFTVVVLNADPEGGIAKGFADAGEALDVSSPKGQFIVRSTGVVRVGGAGLGSPVISRTVEVIAQAKAAID